MADKLIHFLGFLFDDFYTFEQSSYKLISSLQIADMILSVFLSHNKPNVTPLLPIMQKR